MEEYKLPLLSSRLMNFVAFFPFLQKIVLTRNECVKNIKRANKSICNWFNEISMDDSRFKQLNVYKSSMTFINKLKNAILTKNYKTQTT